MEPVRKLLQIVGVDTIGLVRPDSAANPRPLHLRNCAILKTPKENDCSVEATCLGVIPQSISSHHGVPVPKLVNPVLPLEQHHGADAIVPLVECLQRLFQGTKRIVLLGSTPHCR